MIDDVEKDISNADICSARCVMRMAPLDIVLTAQR